MTFAAFLVGMVGPLLARILTSLGLTLVTLTGVTVIFGQLKDSVVGAVNSMPADALAIGGLMGLWQALGILLGALSFSITWKATTGFIGLAKS